MTNMKPKGGASIEAPSLRGLQRRSATGLNGQAAQQEVSALWREGWMPENISGVPAGRSVFHLTSPFIGLLARVLESPFRELLRDYKLSAILAVWGVFTPVLAKHSKSSPSWVN